MNWYAPLEIVIGDHERSSSPCTANMLNHAVLLSDREPTRNASSRCRTLSDRPAAQVDSPGRGSSPCYHLAPCTLSSSVTSVSQSCLFPIRCISVFSRLTFFHKTF
jgi:hypothetical protein